MAPDLASLLAHEERLQRAQLTSDVDELDTLIHDELVFVGPDGARASKADDLAAHRSGLFRFTAVEAEDVDARVVGDVGITVFTGRLAGEIAGEPFEARMRYTRTWVGDDDGDGWRILAAHASILGNAVA